MKLNNKQMHAIVGGRERVVEKIDLDGDGRWDIKHVDVYNSRGELVRSRTRIR